jgi:signal transduction histidine kinase
VDLASLTADLASVFRSAVERAGLKFVVDCPPLESPVYVDREMWEKIVLNLVSNAFKFTFEGTIDVRLRSAGENAELTVRDSGVGIAAEDVTHIFERFYRVNNVNGRSYEGSGIGLALVQELVKLNGGEIRVESTFGRGTTFTVTIPFGKDHLPSERIGVVSKPLSDLNAAAFLQEALRWLPDNGSVAESPVPVPLPSESRQRGRIVLAEDNSDMRQYVQRLLADSYEVEAVPDGEAALNAVHREIPDLVLTDVMMPKLDGIGLVKALRKNVRTSSIPVIQLSARAGEEARVEGLRAGVDDYLAKPFSARELIARVENLLALAKSRRATERALLQAEKLASLGRMAASISHEINNPLESITNLIYLARMTPAMPDSARDQLQLVDEELKRIAHITRQSLGFYRESSIPTPTSVDDVLDSAIELMKGKITAKQASIYRERNENVNVMAVPGEMRQVFSNLLANSLDAIEERGSIRIRVATRTYSNNHRFVRITIADSGKGISPQSRESIFEPFFTTKEKLGTGLGLWVVKQIVDKHSGTIRMRSRSESAPTGTVFSIALPIEEPGPFQPQS